MYDYEIYGKLKKSGVLDMTKDHTTEHRWLAMDAENRLVTGFKSRQKAQAYLRQLKPKQLA